MESDLQYSCHQGHSRFIHSSLSIAEGTVLMASVSLLFRDHCTQSLVGRGPQFL